MEISRPRVKLHHHPCSRFPRALSLLDGECPCPSIEDEGHSPPPPPLQRGPLCYCRRTSFHFLFRGPSQVFSQLIFTPSASISEKGAFRPDQLGEPVIKPVGGREGVRRGPFVAPKLLFNTGNVVQPKGTFSTAIGGPNYCSLTPG